MSTAYLLSFGFPSLIIYRVNAGVTSAHPYGPPGYGGPLQTVNFEEVFGDAVCASEGEESAESEAEFGYEGQLLTPACEVVKSPSDKREYRALILPNKMKVMLISDPKTDMSAASMSVAAGELRYKQSNI
jgi:hypothetical protein